MNQYKDLNNNQIKKKLTKVTIKNWKYVMYKYNIYYIVHKPNNLKIAITLFPAF